MIARALCLFVLLLSAAPARAQDASEATTREDARALFEQGTDALRRESYDEAIALLARSHALLPNVANAFNLGVALSRAGRASEAVALFAELESGALGALGDEQRAAVRERALEARQQLAVLEISVTGAVDPTITIDGVILAGRTAELDPGPHRIHVTAPGVVAETRSLEARAGVVTNVAFELRAETPVSAPIEPPAPPSDDTATWAWAIGTTSVVLIAGGIVLGVVLATSGPSPVVDPVTGIGETLTLSTRF